MKLKSEGIARITFAGFSDYSKGLDNILLSKARANTVRAHLKNYGIIGKFVVNGNGSTRLVSLGHKQDKLERRVEIWVTPIAQAV